MVTLRANNYTYSVETPSGEFTVDVSYDIEWRAWIATVTLTHQSPDAGEAVGALATHAREVAACIDTGVGFAHPVRHAAPPNPCLVDEVGLVRLPDEAFRALGLPLAGGAVDVEIDGGRVVLTRRAS